MAVVWWYVAKSSTMINFQLRRYRATATHRIVLYMAIVGLTSLFAVMAPTDDPRLATAIQTQFPADYLKVAPGQWLIAATGTSKDISDRLKVTDGAVGSAIIVAFSGYYGRSSTSTWEWIASRMGARPSV